MLVKALVMFQRKGNDLINDEQFRSNFLRDTIEMSIMEYFTPFHHSSGGNYAEVNEVYRSIKWLIGQLRDWLIDSLIG